MDNHSFIQDIIAYIRTAVRERSVTNLMEARVMQFLLDRLTEVDEMLEAETAARKADAGSLQTALQQKVDAVMQLIRGQGASASARQYPFLDLGNVASQQAVNEVFDSIYQASDDKYNGPMRIARNGALILLSQHVVKALPGEPWHWAQCAAGMITPAADGASLSAASAFNICVRYTDYQGNATPWRLVSGSGTMQLKTVNGQSLIGEGNITISASGQINIDSQVNPSSPNAVSGAAVAAAIGELAAVIQSLTVDEALSPSSSKPVANAVVTAALQNHSGQIAGLQDEVASLGDVAHQPQVLRFGGFISSTVNTREESFSGTVDTQNILYYEREKTFVYRSGGLYYLSFPGVGAYKQGGYPVADALYLYNGNVYEWRQNTLSPISGGGSSTPAEVSVDDVTITKKSVGGVDKIALADNDKSSANTLGTVLLTDNVMPEAAANTRYLLYKDINYGNQRRQTLEGMEPLPESISLAPGSKLVPNGGMPKIVDIEGNESPMLVTGGELSWVHSSDIGMIQDGALPSGMTRAQVGAHNADVLRMVAASRWNLILDGMYYVDVQIAASASRETLVANAVTLRRPLRIKGGGLTAARYLFCVEAGGGLVMEDVVLDNLESYAMIYIDPWGGLIESVELYRCTLKTSAAPKSGAPYAYVGRFVRGAGKNVGHVDWVNEYTPNGISRCFNETNGVKFLGLPRSVDVTEGGKTVKKSCWGLKSATASTPTQHYCYNGVPFPGSKNAVWADAWCCYDQGAQLYAPYAAGEYVFRQRADSKTKHKGMAGDFVPQSETRGTDTLYTENGTVVLFTPVYMHDDLVDGVLVRGANPDVEHNGIRKFIVDGCSIMSHSEVFIFGGLAVEEEFRISNNLFYEMVRQAMNLGTGNDDESSDYWNAMSCPLEVCGNTFRGVGYVVESDQPYACALLYEGNTVLFHDNVLENLITTTNTYDCYLSCGKLEYRNNIIRNVLKWKNPDHSLYGYMKAKGTRDDFVYVNKYKDRMKSHPRKFSRVYEGNLFEENLKDVRQICESYLQKYRSTYLPDYDGVAWDEVPQEAKDDVLKENVLRTMFDNVVSLWSFDTFTVRNNVFDMPDCMLNGSATSGGSAKLRRFLFNGNVMKFRGFCSSPNGGYNKYLFTIDPTAEGAEAEIIGNSFESKGGEIINTLCVLGTEGVSELFKSFRVEDNKFVNCGYRIAGPSHVGNINAESFSISGNKEAAGLDEGYEIHASELDDYSRNIYALTYWQYESGYNVLGKESSKFKIQGVPVMYSGPGVFEFWDSQKQGVAANAPKYILLPTDKSRVVIKSTHLCRPAPCFLNSAADTNPSARYSTHIRTVANSSLLTITDIEDCPVNEEVTLECGSVSSGVKIVKSGSTHFAGLTADWVPAVGDRIVLKKTMTWEWQTIDGVKTKVYNWSFAEVSRSTASEHASAVDLPDFFANKSLVFGYDKKDVKGYCMTVRYRLKGMWKEKKVEFRCNSYATNYRSASARGADGCRFGNYQTATSVKYFEIGGMEDLGLHFALRHFSLNSAATTNASFICLNVFTDAEGTRNDPGTDMTIEVCDITGNADAVKSGSFNYGDTSLFESFLPKGSTLTAAERTALLTGDVSAFNMMPQSDAVTRQATLTAGDAGWWCVDPVSGHVVVWTGSAWSE